MFCNGCGRSVNRETTGPGESWTCPTCLTENRYPPVAESSRSVMYCVSCGTNLLDSNSYPGKRRTCQTCGTEIVYYSKNLWESLPGASPRPPQAEAPTDPPVAPDFVLGPPDAGKGHLPAKPRATATFEGNQVRVDVTLTLDEILTFLAHQTGKSVNGMEISKVAKKPNPYGSFDFVFTLRSKTSEN